MTTEVSTPPPPAAEPVVEETPPPPPPPEPKHESPISNPLAEEQCQWLPRALEEDPELLALRERSLAWTGGISFANMIHTQLTASPVVFNRYSILQLIYNHFLSVGMENTAEKLQIESGHDFQVLEEPWERTGLRILASLGVLPSENPWDISGEVDCKFINEFLEEDLFSCHYRENQRLIYQEILNPSINIEFGQQDKTFKSITKCTLKRMIVIAVLGDLIDPNLKMKDEDVDLILISIQQITSNEHFLQNLFAMFYLDFSDESASSEISSKVPNIKLRVVNLMQRWINFSGLFIGRKTLKLMLNFAQAILDSTDTSQEINECRPVLKNIVLQIPVLTYGIQNIEEPTKQNPQISAEVVPKLFNPKFNLTIVESVEVAKQITLLLYDIYKLIPAREFAYMIQTRRFSMQVPKITEFLEATHRFERVIIEAIVKHGNRNEALNYILNLANCLDSLANYAALASIMKIITIPELKFSIKQAKLEDQFLNAGKKVSSSNEGVQLYNNTIISRYDNSGPTIPNLSVDILSTAIPPGDNFIDGVAINWKRRYEIAKKLVIYYRFQNSPYGIWPVQQIQRMILNGGTIPDKILMEKLAGFPTSN
ncbi:RasGEF domain containing protein [Trichomonas vaginalis G3]|uniref:RasGEF domain containing protein n=1 Tax=Trichomonas vaginalis (strain ATCC PRA-98 / G3) TaxID=412133 RepID=A2D892_TRIV3|nr:guanyl-nucleotide exchange factor protein [Trichomonas vaginalis G3]EAY23525.1 RasGEF domain containing protein [Trichomonas vaginalis G3]KAI5493947.1 guanyl-nucleotide exchange factor protein [Trichomonas vaginalis G3]|eukprot:XP_001584511.1 RasGEF domain containing protein [Trichomonas vaginalis G3]